MKYLFSVMCLMAACMAQAQRYPGEVPQSEQGRGFAYLETVVPEREVLPYPNIREADVMYSQHVERTMDTREKQNLLCQHPKNPLYQVIFDAVERGEIMAYKSDSFTDGYRKDTVLDMFGTTEIIRVPDRDYPGEMKDSTIISPYPIESIYRWRVIEEWIVEKQTGELVPRIVGVAPMMNLSAQGVDLGEYEGFYIKWSEARQLLVNEKAFNPHNDATAFTYYDFFEQQRYAATVTKESNAFDLDFAEYPELINNPLAQLLEAEKAKEKQMNFESDLWQY